MNNKKSKTGTLLLYVHGRSGTAVEVAHYRSLFPDCDAVGLDYRAETPWNAETEFPSAFQAISAGYDRVLPIANSIGAYFSMCALPQETLTQAYFISPIVDMEHLILRMMGWANVTEALLRETGPITTAFRETLSWEYLSYVRAHPARWRVPTEILYGEQDPLTDRETVTFFAAAHHAGLTVMPGDEHWVHTPAQLAFLDNWLRTNERRGGS